MGQEHISSYLDFRIMPQTRVKLDAVYLPSRWVFLPPTIKRSFEPEENLLSSSLVPTIDNTHNMQKATRMWNRSMTEFPDTYGSEDPLLPGIRLKPNDASSTDVSTKSLRRVGRKCHSGSYEHITRRWFWHFYKTNSIKKEKLFQRCFTECIEKDFLENFTHTGSGNSNQDSSSQAQWVSKRNPGIYYMPVCMILWEAKAQEQLLWVSD